MTADKIEKKKSMPFEEVAKKIQENRNQMWKNAWDEWEPTTFVDHVIAKLKRAYNVRTNPTYLSGCLVDAYNYANELKRRLKEQQK